MQDKTLLYAALTCSAIGLMLLAFIPYELPDDVFMAELDDTVRIKGNVLSVEDAGVTIVKIRTCAVVDAVSFDDIEVSGNITIVGRVSEYDGKRQLIIEEIS